MISPVETIIRKATRKDDEPLNILTFATHERYQTHISHTGHNFYLWDADNIKPWKYEYAPLPQNHILLNKHLKDRQIPDWVDIDLVWSQNKAGQFQTAYQLAQTLKVPLVSLEHTLPMPNWSIGQLKAMKMMRGDINVFISSFSRERWGWAPNEAEVIHHGLDINFFKPLNIKRGNYILVVCNDYINRDWCCGFNIFAKVTGWPNEQKIPFKAFGSTPGFSEPVSSTEQLVKEYNECGVFLNTATHSPVPTVLLEAMACGTPVVSTRNPLVSEIIQNGVNGFLADNPDDLRSICQMLINNPIMGKTVGDKARETITQNFNVQRFVNDWNVIFKKAMEINK